MRASNMKLNTNRTALIRLFERGERKVSREFIRGAGFDFNYFIQNTTDQLGNYMAVYDYIIKDLRNGYFNISITTKYALKSNFILWCVLRDLK